MKSRTQIHTHCGRSARLSLAALGASLSLGLPDESAAEQGAVMVPASELIEDRVSAEDRLSIDSEGRRTRPPRWLGENFTWRKHVGLEYSRALKLGDHPIELGVQGPLHRKKKRAGLMLEIRF